MKGFLSRLRRKSSAGSSKKKASESLQRQLDAFQPPPSPPEKRRQPIMEVSVKQFENEVNDHLKDFQFYVRQIKVTSLRLEELTKLLKSGEIPVSSYRLIMDELGDKLSLSVDDISKLREVLELAKAKAKLEWAKEKVSAPAHPSELQESGKSQFAAYTRDTRRSTSTDLIYSDYPVSAVPLDLIRWEELVSKIDAALASLSIVDEAGIIEQYLSIIKEKLSSGAITEEVERATSVCQQRLTFISDRWASIRRNQIEQIMNLELEASKVKDEIKELEVRFAVGELLQEPFEYRMSTFQTAMKKVEKEISDIRRSIDDMDMKIFRCSELLRENP